MSTFSAAVLTWICLYAAACSSHDEITEWKRPGGAGHPPAAVTALAVHGGADLNRARHDGATAIHLAAHAGQARLVTRLLALGADVVRRPLRPF